jgi:hypothetical protein
MTEAQADRLALGFYVVLTATVFAFLGMQLVVN